MRQVHLQENTAGSLAALLLLLLLLLLLGRVPWQVVGAAGCGLWRSVLVEAHNVVALFEQVQGTGMTYACRPGNTCLEEGCATNEDTALIR
jgi:hypothetical protein